MRLRVSINQAGSVRAMKDVGKVASAIKLPSRADASARDSNARHVCFGTRHVLARFVSRHHRHETAHRFSVEEGHLEMLAVMLHRKRLPWTGISGDVQEAFSQL